MALKQERKIEGGCYPIPAQQLLLKAALLKDDRAIAAWKQWQLNRDLEDLDLGSYRLLPLLYQNLTLHDIKHPFLAKMKGVYRYTWSQNQVLLAQLSIVLDTFSQAGIKTMILKGAALVNLYYKNYGLRPMSDFDVFVRKSDLPEVIKILNQQNWFLEDGTLAVLPDVSTAHAYMFKNKSGQQLDLHWHLMYESLRYQDYEDIWEKSIPIQVQNSNTLALNPTDQLFHVCVHGAVWNIVPPIRWVADAMTILETQPEIDWERLGHLSQHYRLVLPLQDTILFLRNMMDVSIPQLFLDNLKSLPISLSTKVEYAKRISPNSKDNYFLTQSPLNILKIYFVNINRDYQNHVKQNADGADFLKFLLSRWQVENLWELTFHTSFKAVRILRRILYSLWARVDR